MIPGIYRPHFQALKIPHGAAFFPALVAGASSTGLMMTGSPLMTLPVAVIFLFARRHFVQGVALTETKG